MSTKNRVGVFCKLFKLAQFTLRAGHGDTPLIRHHCAESYWCAGPLYVVIVMSSVNQSFASSTQQ